MRSTRGPAPPPTPTFHLTPHQAFPDSPKCRRGRVSGWVGFEPSAWKVLIESNLWLPVGRAISPLSPSPAPGRAKAGNVGGSVRVNGERLRTAQAFKHLCRPLPTVFDRFRPVSDRYRPFPAVSDRFPTVFQPSSQRDTVTIGACRRSTSTAATSARTSCRRTACPVCRARGSAAESTAIFHLLCGFDLAFGL